MILLCGHPQEAPMAAVAAAAETLGLAVTMLDQRYTDDYDLDLRFAEGRIEATLGSVNGKIDLSTVTGAFVRLLDWSAGSDVPAAILERRKAFYGLLSIWLEVSPARVLNRPRASATNGSKPLQTALIAAAGLATPETLVTNDPDELHRFRAEFGRLVFKSTSGVRSIVRELTQWTPDDEMRLRCLPTQFQPLIEGVDVRAHVIGDTVFAAEIESTHVDYRYAAMEGGAATLRATTLPGDVREACLRVSQSLGLPLCGIDLKRTLDGRYFCFEANPAPAFSYFEENTGLPIAAAIARHLAGE